MNLKLSRRDTLALLAALGVPRTSGHAEEGRGGNLTKGVTLENDHVRVLEFVSPGGSAVCGTGRHFHPAHLTVWLTSVRIRSRKDDGTTTVADRKAGDVAWFEAGWHAAESIGPEGTRTCMVEIKDRDWKPSTG